VSVDFDAGAEGAASAAGRLELAAPAVAGRAAGPAVGSAPELPAFVTRGAVPNPARPGTAFRFALGAGGGPVSVAIYDVAGRLVRRIESPTLAPGEHALAWDGRDDRGRAVAAGLYVYRITAPGGTATHKLLLER
jgi:hypothetical protein